MRKTPAEKSIMNLKRFAPPAAKKLWRRLRERPAPPAPTAESLRAAAAKRSRRIVRTLDGLPDATGALNPNLIFDIGMHVGQDSDYYLRKGFDVVAVEANPMLAAAGEKRFARQLRERQLTLLNVGVGETRGQAEFHVNLELSEWSSFKPATASRGMPTAAVSVEMVTIADIVRKFGVPYYLKIDIEGLDGAAVRGLSECPVKPRYVSFENGDPPLFELLVSFGYTGFKFINQADVPAQVCPIPAREGRTIAHAFPYGASGAFGDDAPGEWLPVEAMRGIVGGHAAARAKGDYDAVKQGWFDLHAKRDV